MAKRNRTLLAEITAAEKRAVDDTRRTLQEIETLDFDDIVKRTGLEGVITPDDLRLASNKLCTALRALLFYESRFVTGE